MEVMNNIINLSEFKKQKEQPDSTREVRLKRDWPEFLPLPTDTDIRELTELSERNTGSSFFEKEKRGENNGGTNEK